MLDILSQTENFLKKSKQVVVARVISTWRSSPRPVGSVMLVNELSEMIGSVSGGCVEKSVLTKSLKIIQSGNAEQAQFGVADEEAWEVGLSCGGALKVFIQPFFSKSEWETIQIFLSKNLGFAVITSLNSNATNRILEADELREFDESAFKLYKERANGMIEKAGEDYFVHSFPPKLSMLLIGSAHITSELVELADSFGFNSIVIDPRDTFAKKTGFKVDPGKIYVKWPQEVLPKLTLDEHTYAVILSHDPKIDDEALKILIDSGVRYIGALGSRKTHAKRVERLKRYGFTNEQIKRIHAPVGLPIHALIPKEIALSVMAEIIQVKNASYFVKEPVY